MALTGVAGTILALTLPSTPAMAINEVPCGPGDYLTVYMHVSAGTPFARCFANGGEVDYSGGDLWLNSFSTGNNRVQWYGDGRWQPDQPVEKWTIFQFPNHAGGVRLDKIRIV
jgi:hypothetical protein